jgi:dihydropteroate synthase
MKGTPQTMQSLSSTITLSRKCFFISLKKVAAARQLGINDLIVDPGFGFAKSLRPELRSVAKTRVV